MIIPNIDFIIDGTRKSLYDSYNLVLSSYRLSAPTPIVYTVDVPGADGLVDLTAVFGRVKYASRKFECTATAVGDRATLQQIQGMILNDLLGKQANVQLYSYPSYYLESRITKISDFNPEGIILKIVIEADCQPYFLKNEITSQTEIISDSKDVTLLNEDLIVSPDITVDSEMTLSWVDKITGGTNQAVISQGTHKIENLILYKGNNLINVKGKGNVVFRYRKGRL